MAIVPVSSAVLFLSALLKSIGPPTDPFFSDQPSIEVVIIKLLWLDSGPGLLILLCFHCGLLEWGWLGCFLPLGSERAQGFLCSLEVFERCVLANTGSNTG